MTPDEAWKGVGKKKNKFNWYTTVVTKKNKLKYQTCGNGGLKQLRTHLEGKYIVLHEDNILY